MITRPVTHALVCAALGTLLGAGCTGANPDQFAAAGDGKTQDADVVGPGDDARPSVGGEPGSGGHGGTNGSGGTGGTGGQAPRPDDAGLGGGTPDAREPGPDGSYSPEGRVECSLEQGGIE